MSENSLEFLLETLDGTERPPSATVRSGPDAETTLVVPCSMSRCEHDMSLWPIGPVETVRADRTLGNQTWEHHEGELVLDGGLAQRAAECDTSAVLVIGHTRCTVIADAYDRHVAPADDVPAGIESRLGPLVSLVADAFDAGVIDTSTPPRTARHRLVEYNVVRQVAFLAETLPDSVTIAGYVYDQDGVYNSFPDKQYLVTVDGETDAAEIRSRLPDDASIPVVSLL